MLEHLHPRSCGKYANITQIVVPLRDMPKEPTQLAPLRKISRGGVDRLPAVHSWDSRYLLKMAITATQGMMAVGLLSVLFGADLMTLLGSKVRA